MKFIHFSMDVSNVHRQTVFKWNYGGGQSAFTLSCRRQSVGSGGSPATSSTPSLAVASAATTSCWGSPALDEACWPPHRQQMLLSSSALGGGLIPQGPCCRQKEAMYPCFMCYIL